MKNMPFLRPLAFLWLLVLATSLSAFAQNGEKHEENKWSIGIGPSYRGGMDLRISGTSRVQEGNLHVTATYRSDPPEVGPENAPADRTYSDGWVRMDPGTQLDGLTWYWSDKRADQYDPGSQTISFHQTGGTMVDRSIDSDLRLSESESLDGCGPTLTLTRQLCSRNSCRIHLGVSLGYVAFGGGASASTFSESYAETAYDVVDVYDASKGGPPPGYPTQAYDCPNGYLGPGYLISNTPTSRQRVPTGSMDFMSASNAVRFDIDGHLLDLRLGPRLDISLGKRAWLILTPAVSLNHVHLDVDRDEDFVASYSDGATAVVQHWSDSGSESDFLFGLGLGAGIEVPLSNRWFLAAHGRYDWVPQEQKMEIGPNKLETDLSGYTVGAEVGVTF